MKHTVGHEALNDQYHVGIIKEKLTRNLPNVLPDLIDELTHAVPDYILANETGRHITDKHRRIQLIVNRSPYPRVDICHCDADDPERGSTNEQSGFCRSASL